jgi:hypothetical protein
MKSYLTAVELLAGRGWQDRAEEILGSQTDRVVRQGQQLLVWSPAARKPFRQGTEFADAIELRRVWLAHGRHALAATARRVYFQTGEEEPLRKPEYEILENSRRPPGPGDAALLASIIGFLQEFRSLADGLVGLPIAVDSQPLASHRAATRAIGAHAYPNDRWDPNLIYKKVGFDHVPAGGQVVVVGCGAVASEGAAPCADHIQKAFAARHAGSVKILLRPMAEVTQRLAGLENGEGAPIQEHTVFHLVLPGDQESDLDQETAALMAGLDRAGLAWRRSYRHDNLRYSVPDQLGSLLQGMGGRAFRIEMPEGLTNLWSVGIDLSHGTRSTLCVSLINPRGVLIGIWTVPHARDETVGKDKLNRLLREAAAAARETDANAHFLVVRDGRLFKHEVDSTYLDPFGESASLIEIRKGNNPLLFLQEEGQSRLPDQPVWATVPHSTTGFLVTYPRREIKTLDRVLKVTWQPAWNKLSLSTEQIGDILVRLSLAPTLGMQRSALPAPIYWADGIAGANQNDLRFRGQSPMKRI